MRKGALAHLAEVDTEIAVRVSPRAARNEVRIDGEILRVLVTAPPEGGKANREVRKLLAHALGLPKTRLSLVRGETGRSKVFRVTE